MLKHVVMWTLREQQKTDNALKLKHLLEAMRGKVEGLVHLEVGININKGADTCDVVLYSVFENGQALAAYNIHPDHLAIKDFVKEIRQHRYQVDYLD